MPDAIAQPSANGHSQSLESEAMEVIASVQSEAPAEAVKPTRKRRGHDDVALEIDGLNFKGNAADIASVIKAMR